MLVFGSLFGLVTFVCFVIVLIKQFQSEGPVQGVIGIVTCGIWTFIWGWLNADRENIKGLMTLWSFSAIVGFILRVLLLLGKG